MKQRNTRQRQSNFRCKVMIDALTDYAIVIEFCYSRGVGSGTRSCCLGFESHRRQLAFLHSKLTQNRILYLQERGKGLGKGAGTESRSELALWITRIRAPLKLVGNRLIEVFHKVLDWSLIRTFHSNVSMRILWRLVLTKLFSC